MASAAGTELKIQAEAPAPVLGDRVDLERAILNLVENAVKYADPETLITISAEASNGAVVVQVSDRGPGIPETRGPNDTCFCR